MPDRPITHRYRELPTISPFRVNTKIQEVEAILREHDNGEFRRSAMLVDELMTDDRVAGVTEQRVSGLLAAPLTFSAATDQRKAEKAVKLIGGADQNETGLWSSIAPRPTVSNLITWGRMLGLAVAEIVWRRSESAWEPYLCPWNPQFVRWDWVLRRFVLQTMDGGQIPLPRPDLEPHGDGKWFVWCPYGVQEGWRRSLIRSLADKYVSRRWNERDWDRYNEVRGIGILRGRVPSGASKEEKQRYLESISNVATEGAVVLPQGSNKDTPGWDLDILEAQARTWEAMKDRRSSLDADIAIRIVGQNLTTEVKEGSRAAAEVQDYVRLDIALDDADIGPAIRDQVLWHWAGFNLGDPELAPKPKYNVLPPEDELQEAQALKALGDALEVLRRVEPRTDVTTIVETAGVPLLTEAEGAAIAEEEAARAAEGAAAAGGGGQGGGGGEEEDQEGAQAALSAIEVRRRYMFAGLPIAVENPAGSIRLWTGPDGQQGLTKMLVDYGFIEGYLSGDDEEIDVYVGPFEQAEDVYVVHQQATPDYRRWDEDKVMVGFKSAEDAREMYLAHRDDGERAFGGMLVLPLERFKAKLRRRDPEVTTKIRASLAGARAALLALTTRRSRRTVAGSRRAARYEEQLMARATRLGARALGADLAAIMEEVTAATSLEDARRRVVRRYRSLRAPAELAEIVRKTNLMAHLSGRFRALQDV